MNPPPNPSNKPNPSIDVVGTQGTLEFEAISLDELIRCVGTLARSRFDSKNMPRVVVSPYRFNPLGAHIDHQGGSAVARTLNQYSVGAFYPSGDRSVTVLSTSLAQDSISFNLGDAPYGENWQRYAIATARVFDLWASGRGVKAVGLRLVVEGTMVGAGLSSSASIILAYLMALADVNQMTLAQVDAVELTRQVENGYMGLNNGIQDQMSIMFGSRDALSQVNVDDITADYWQDAPNLNEVQWLVCYSGFSRELIASSFNDRVSECKQAAALLSELSATPGTTKASATRLGDVPIAARTSQAIAALPDALGRRAQHVYSEIQRVSDAKSVWEAGRWDEFGALMNASCKSSIENYECGSEPMRFLHTVAANTDGVYGSRFSGGGYGGCLIMLVNASCVNRVGGEVLSAFVERYPDKIDVASVFVARAEAAARVL